ncbi:hypothetical protein PPTG_05683 [Phytophthora nicotianae INRA-310]|uniref:Ankyrin repeat-containing domain n=3 Tax=Phytophthora nicotianae TaxID=4792 RepID=W2QTQ9_PHYN3|nr:hypothetical protein PPTG_05683 [Phytophthora nicotianae INRA-310]ETI32920.1 hypothetical protein F443_20347 [Phytophthora nicotianae P1569]ETM33178.1 hypothetical protein L914_19554 [Phytophthora nicotianae]ETN16483.1 hypothetical protein PPTG_05683 [Phytophthora nicotianae INRA-310]
MVSNNTMSQLPVLTKVRVLGRHCLHVEMPHVLLTINALLDAFSAGKKAHEVYERTGSLRLMQYVAAREPIEEMDPFYRRYQFNRTVEIAAANGDLETVKWLIESHNPDFLSKAVAAAAANGHLHILQWLFDTHREIGYWGATEMCGALENSQAKVVEWLRENAVPRKDSLKKVMEAAAAAGNVEVVEWLFKDCRASAEDALWSAQTNKQWEMAKWILDNCGIVGPWIDWDLPAKDGALSFMQYLRSRSIGGPGFYTLQVAALNGHVEVVEWLHDELRVPFSPTLWHAADNGHLNVIQWMHDNGYKHGGAAIMDSAAMYGQLDVVKWLHDNREEGCTEQAMDGAATEGHLEVVRWLHESRSEGCTNAAMNGAASKGHLDVVKWLHSHRHEGCTHVAMDSAAENGYLHVIQWLQKNRSEGCTPAAMDTAASKGHLDVVRWLHENRSEGCTTKAMDMAAENGHFEVVKWLHENRNEGCTTDAMDTAAANGYFAIVKYLHENRDEGCTVAALTRAILGAHFEVALFLKTHRSEGFALNRNSIIRLPLELMQWLIANNMSNLQGYEFEVERCDWRFNEWCREIKLRMAHQNEQSVWWECSSETVRPEAH